MPAPPQPAIYTALKGNLPPVFKNPTITAEQDAWLQALSSELNGAWSDWQGGIVGGGLEVCGSGLSTWTGTGTGGSLTENGTLGWPNPKPSWSPEIDTLNGFLVAQTKAEFSEWVSAYSFDAAAYEGTTTATPDKAGTFDATALGTEAIGDVGSGEFPAPIQPDVTAALQGAGWYPNRSVAKIIEWLDAYDDMIQGRFQWWLDNTLWVDNTVQGPSAAGTGSGCGTSNNDGALN